MNEPETPESGPAEGTTSDSGSAQVESTPMGRNFYLVMALIGVMIFLIIFFNVPGTRASAVTTLVTSNWTLKTYADTTGLLVPVTDGTQITAHFGRDGLVSGSAGCNQYAAAYMVKEYALTITAPRSTKMYCSAPGVMEQETLYLSDIANATSFRIHDPDLNLYDASGRMTAVFRPEAQ
jgi:heat shock protein HslJ